ncbi:MAG: HEAT repeat domain-containing protein [Candidatus Nanoarchaeia archaeon]
MSIILAIGLFYPLLAGLWEKAPLDSNIDCIQAEKIATDEVVSEQFKLLQEEIKDPRTRCATAHNLGLTRNKLAAKMLEDAIVSEKDENVLLESMISIWNLREIRKPSRIEFYRENMASEVPIKRTYSRLLFIAAGGSQEELFKSLETESYDFSADMAWNELFLSAKAADCAKARPFLKSPLLANRRGAAKFIGTKEQNEKALDEDFKIIEQDHPSVAISFAEGIITGKNKAGIAILDKLSSSPIVPVRSTIATAQIQDQRMEKILIRLSSDKDCEIRRLSCVSLGAFKTDSSIETLISSLRDIDFYVRTASEDSLIKLNPDKAFIKRIADLLNDSVARNSAIKILGELNHKEYSEKIFKFIADDSDTETLRRAIRALDIFNLKKSSAKIAAFSEHKDDEVRVAVASALGTFNDPSTYSALRKLDKDKVNKVRLEAIKAIGRTKTDSFADILEQNLKEYTSAPEIRAYAAWAVAKTGSCNNNIGNALEKIISQEIIPMEAGRRTYDALFSRTSAFWALMVLGNKNSTFQAKGKAILKKYRENPPGDDLSGESLEQMLYYFDQAVCYVEGRKVQQKEVPVIILNDISPVNKIKNQK